MLAEPATNRISADEEHPTATGKGVAQRSRLVEVAVAHLGAASAKLAQGLRSTSDEDKVLRRDALEQLLGDEAAKMARRSRDDEAHRTAVPVEENMRHRQGYAARSTTETARSDGTHRTRGHPAAGLSVV